MDAKEIRKWQKDFLRDENCLDSKLKLTIGEYENKDDAYDVAARKSVNEALSRNTTYNEEYNSKRYNKKNEIKKDDFRNHWKGLLIKLGELYLDENNNILHDAHCRHIEDLSKDLSEGRHGEILLLNDKWEPRLRIGAAQKSLNLYLKYLWCWDEIKTTPPDCTVDRIILQAAFISDKWTECDCIKRYKRWIKCMGEWAKDDGFDNLAEWELFKYQQNRNKTANK